MTRIYRLAAALALALATALVAPLAAHAAGFQFWGYYQLIDGEWGFATEGAGTTVPEDGSVDGYRFAVSAGDDVRVPRDVLEFDEVCAETPAEDGMKRVGLVLDPGRDVDAPEGVTPPQPAATCVLAEPDATSQEILVQVVEDLRTDDSGLICGIAGYPEEGCGEPVPEPTEEQLAEDEPIEIAIAAPGTDIGDVMNPTEEPTATEEPTEEATTTDEATEEATEEATTSEETTSDETATEEATTEDEAIDEEPADEESTDESDEGIPPWAWVVGVVLLLGLLAWAASAARNRRLDAAGDGYEDDPYRGDQYPDDRYPGDRYPGDDNPDDRYPGDDNYPRDDHDPDDDDFGGDQRRR